jgi:hypothetical protein
MQSLVIVGGWRVVLRFGEVQCWGRGESGGVVVVRGMMQRNAERGGGDVGSKG